jgi:hypothetical protein
MGKRVINMFRPDKNEEAGNQYIPARKVLKPFFAERHLFSPF